jgi:hypothetical protein
MKIRWKSGDTPGKVEYLDYGAVQQALVADPESLEILYGLDDPDAPGDEGGDAEMRPERQRHPGAAPDLSDKDAHGLTRDVPGRGLDTGDAGRVGPSTQHKTEGLPVPDAKIPLQPGAQAPKQSPKDQSEAHTKEMVEKHNVKADEASKKK